MRKFLSLILVLCLSAGMTLAVRASTIDATTPEATHGVEAVYRPGEETPTVSVDIEWEGFSFTYTGDSGFLWDAEEHTYRGEDGGSWEPSDASVTITNHSNTLIQANIRYEAAAGFEETELYFTDTAPIIGSAETGEEEAGTPCAVTVKAIPGGTLPETALSATRIGTVTVSVRAGLEGSDMQIAAYNRLRTLHEGVVGAGYDAQNMTRGAVHYPSAEKAEEILAMMERLGETVCRTEYPVTQRNAALNELITAFYGSLEICQNNN